MSILLKYK